VSDSERSTEQYDVDQRRRSALKHAIVLGLVSLGFLLLFILRTTAEA
jgi:hypothetical protein